MNKEQQIKTLKKRFKYPLDTIYYTGVILKDDAFTNPSGSIIEQIDLFGFTKDDVCACFDILDGVLRKISHDNQARLVLGCTDDMSLQDREQVIDNISYDIKAFFNRLTNNVPDVAASKDKTVREIDYDKLQKGFRVIAQVLDSGRLEPDIVAATIITIRDSSVHCFANWKHILIGLMIQFEDQIKDMLGDKCKTKDKRVFLNNEEDVLYTTIVDVFYEARNHVAEYLVSNFINEYLDEIELDDYLYDIVHAEGNIAHYKDLCMNYLNAEYGFNVPQLDVQDEFLSDEMKEFMEFYFEEYLSPISLHDFTYDSAVEIFIDRVNRQPNIMIVVFDWFLNYLSKNNFNKIDRDTAYDFFCKYITCGDHNQRLQYFAIQEIMLSYGFIKLTKLDKLIFRRSRVDQVLSSLGDVTSQEKRKILMPIRKSTKVFIMIASHPAFSHEDIWESYEIRNIIKGFAKSDLAILYACNYNNKPMVEYLLDKGASLESEDKMKQTPLFLSYRRKSMDVFEYLLKKGANIHTKDLFGNTILMIACGRNDFATVKCLVENKVDVNIASLEDGDTALMIACKCNNLDIARYLIEHGAYVNIANKDDETALEFACQNNNRDLELLLLTNFASIVDTRGDVFDLLETDLIKTHKCMYILYIQSMLCLSDEKPLKDVLKLNINMSRLDCLSKFLDEYSNLSDVTTYELKNCVDFLERKRSSIKEQKQNNQDLLSMLDKQIARIKGKCTPQICISKEEGGYSKKRLCM